MSRPSCSARRRPTYARRSSTQRGHVLVDDLPVVIDPDEDHRALLIEGDRVAGDLAREVPVERRERHVAEDVDGQVIHIDERMFESAEGRPLAGRAGGRVATRTTVLELGERGAVQVERFKALEVPGRSGRPDLLEAVADLSLGVGGGSFLGTAAAAAAGWRRYWRRRIPP